MWKWARYNVNVSRYNLKVLQNKMISRKSVKLSLYMKQTRYNVIVTPVRLPTPARMEAMCFHTEYRIYVPRFELFIIKLRQNIVSSHFGGQWTNRL